MKIGWFSDWIGVSSGFGTVARNILTRLQSRGHDVSQLAVGWSPWKSYSAMPDPSDKAPPIPAWRAWLYVAWVVVVTGVYFASMLAR